MKECVKKTKSLLNNSAGRKFSAQSNMSTDFMSSIHSNSGDRNKEDTKTNYTQLMQERWNKANMNLPEVDIQDIMDENPMFNSGKKVSPEHQHHPEFTQSSYLRLRSMEEALAMKNYFRVEKSKKQSLGQKIASSIGKKSDGGMTELQRSFGIQKIFDLHQKKDYKEETLFIAASIFDRYINILGVSHFNKALVLHLATIAVLMSAKLEQPISPSFTRMINLLSPEEKKNVTKQSLIDLESDILVKLGFDFNFPGPVQTMERYLRVLGYDLNRSVFDMSF